MEFRIVNQDGNESITVFLGGEFHTVAESHPNYQEIRTRLLNWPAKTVPDLPGWADPEKYLEELLDISHALARNFEKVSDRVSVANGQVYFDYEPVDSSLSRTILRFHEENIEFSPLVKFFEKLETNPNEHSRQQLYDWIRARDFTITSEGEFLAYKGVTKDGDKLVSCHAGNAIVDGREHLSGPVPNAVGSTIELPRSGVEFNPGVGCSYGLHAGTYDYAKNYGNVVLKVVVNPRDVVSVPTDSYAAKLRVCRYRTIEVTEDNYTEPVFYEQPEFDVDDEFCAECGIPIDPYEGSELCANCFEEQEGVEDEESTSRTAGEIYDEAINSLPDDPLSLLGPTQRAALNYIAAPGNRLNSHKIKNIAQSLNISRDAAKNALYRLEEKGYAERVDSGLPGRVGKFSATRKGAELFETSTGAR